MGELEGKVALITGAAQGIGFGVARVLVREGAKVVLNDVKTEALQAAVESLRQGGAEAEGFVGDAAVASEIEAVVSQALAAFGRIDGLVNNAGLVRLSPLLEHKLSDWNDVIAVNLTGIFLWCQKVLRVMSAQGSGSIVNISSVAALGHTTPHASYTASKAGVLALTRELAFEFGPMGVRVNAILPGLIRTQMTESSAQTRRARGEAVPTDEAHGASAVGRWGRPEDVGEAASFLLSDRSSYILGASLVVAGGADLRIMKP
jgi:NAD(P)-dependent dehydrogenase (short-subunit alcohol dehydrogenase family)